MNNLKAINDAINERYGTTYQFFKSKGYSVNNSHNKQITISNTINWINYKYLKCIDMQMIIIDENTPCEENYDIISRRIERYTIENLSECFNISIKYNVESKHNVFKNKIEKLKEYIEGLKLSVFVCDLHYNTNVISYKKLYRL